MSTAVDVRNVSFSVGPREILRQIDLSVREGVFLGIVGPNGGGKTTLLKIVLGILMPSGGTVSLFGRPPGEQRGKGVVGYLPQHMAVDRYFPASAADVVSMGLCGVQGVSRRERTDRVAALLGLMGVGEKAKHTFGELSGGEQQRVGIARALVSEPRVLVLDEPSTGIDVIGQEEFYLLLGDLRKSRNLTILMVSHDIGSISAHVDDLACLNTVIHYHGAPSGVETADLMKKMYGKNVDLIRHGDVCDHCERLR